MRAGARRGRRCWRGAARSAWRSPTPIRSRRWRSDVARLDLIALHFPKFSDGRAYSQARLLRERLGYQGELRATGGVLQDQLPFMLRCGFDSFESDQKGFGEALARARTLFSVVYQPTEDGRATPSLLRLNRRNVTDDRLESTASG